ncbi:TPA: hypothetical protein ACX37Z_004267 [Serratia marcescens]
MLLKTTPEAVLRGLEDRIHFYFCLLVAVGLSKKLGRITSNRQKMPLLLNG